MQGFALQRDYGEDEFMTIVIVLFLGLVVGVLVGLLGIGGGVVLVPALVYLLGYDQHLAQGTSLLILLPPIGLGALRQYWKNGNVDLQAGICCAVGFLLGKMPPLLPETFRGLSKAVLALEGFEAALRDAGGPKDAEAARALLKAAQARCGVKGKDFFMPLRLALSGMEHGPELVQWLPLCPAELWRERIHAALPLLELI